jgi:hypothetical protein
MKPKLLIIGDSISIGYTPAVAEALADEFVVAHGEGNASDSGQMLANLPDYLEADADAVRPHFEGLS